MTDKQTKAKQPPFTKKDTTPQDKEKWRTDIKHNFKNYIKVEFNELKKGDLVKYYSKGYTYKNKENKEGWRGGGFITIIEPDFIGIKSTYGNGIQFTAQKDNIKRIVKSVKVNIQNDTEEHTEQKSEDETKPIKRK